MFHIRAKSVMGWPIWLVEVGEPIDADGSVERPVKFINNISRAAVLNHEDAEQLMQFVLKVRPEAEIVPMAKTE